MADVAVMLPVGWPAPRITELAREAADAGVDELWVAEDLGLHGGIALATHLLATVPEVPIGLGIAPAAARHPAFLAMQAATIAQLHPGRFHLGVGHGMPAWMRQLGLWSASPVALLEATLVGLRSLLAGDRVELDRAGMLIDDVALATAPVEVPLYAGVRGPRSLTACAPHVDGVILAGWSGPAYTRWAADLVAAAADGRRRVVSSARLAFDDRDGERAVQRLAAQLQRDVGRGGLDDQLAPVGLDEDDPALLGEIGIAGGQAEVADGLQRWADGGADVVLFDPLTPDDLERLLAAGLPVSGDRARPSARTSGLPPAAPRG
jgi:5,10-methylenetetrahydromethanopterin reductase